MRDFAWTEDEVDAKRARLARSGDVGNAERPTVFCFQTAVQAILWSKVAYNFLCAAALGAVSALVPSRMCISRLLCCHWLLIKHAASHSCSQFSSDSD